MVDKSLSIQGLGANNLTIDGAHNSRVFNINDGSGTKIDVTIGKLTISNGNATKQGGGGIKNQENLIVNKSIITNNSADFGGRRINRRICQQPRSITPPLAVTRLTVVMEAV